MAGGGKGGSQTTQVEIPEWAENAAIRNLGRADEISRIGYTPYYGPDVAAFTPDQNAAFANTNAAASAFGMAQGGAGMPAPETFAGGIQGYSSGGLFDQAVSELQERRPGQYDAIMNQFINPLTGEMPEGAAWSLLAPPTPVGSGHMNVFHPDYDPLNPAHRRGMGDGQNTTPGGWGSGGGLSFDVGSGIGGSLFDAAFGDPFGGY